MPTFGSTPAFSFASSASPFVFGTAASTPLHTVFLRVYAQAYTSTKWQTDQAYTLHGAGLYTGQAYIPVHEETLIIISRIIC